MKNYHKILGITLAIVFLMPANLLAVSAQEEILREEVVWAAGHWATPNHWNPGYWGGEAWGGLFMYMPMFDYNYETDTLMPMIGESMEWSADGSELQVSIHEEAEWSDGVPITSHDVDFTFNWWYPQTNFGGGWNDRVANFTIIDNKTFVVEMNENYTYSKDIWEKFLGGSKPMPEHTWRAISLGLFGEPIENKFWDLGNWAFANDWLGQIDLGAGLVDFPEEWKVCSGPYYPYFVPETKDKEVYKKYTTWWGDGVLTDGYADMPTYIGHLIFATNFAMNSAFRNNEIDWYGGYYPRIWELLEENPYIQTWMLEDPYYLPISGMVQVVPNWDRYPLNQLWMREAMAYAINYEDLSEISASGYLEKARIGWVDDRSPSQADFYDDSLEEDYAFSYDLEEAIAILEANCYDKGGAWYTNDAGMYEGTPGLGGDPVADDDPDTEGVNYMIGEMEIIVPYGWSDSMMQSTLLGEYFSAIGLVTGAAYQDYGTYLSNGVSDGVANFDLMHFVMGFGPAGTVYGGLGSFIGSGNSWSNHTRWTGSAADLYKEKHQALEVATPGSAEETQLAYDLQEILAQTVPAIPIAPNGYWYTYNAKYWTGWPNEDDPYMQATAPWATGNSGALLNLLLNLQENVGNVLPDRGGDEPTDDTTDDTPTDDTTDDTPTDDTDDTPTGGIPGFPMGIIAVAVIASVSVLIYRKRK